MARRPGLNLDRIVEASLELIQQKGEQALTFAALAGHFGIRPPSLYNHVRGVDALKRELRLRGLRQLRASLLAAVAGRSAFEALHALSQAYRQFAQEQPALYRMTLASTEQDDEELKAAGRACLEVILSILHGYRLEGDQALHATRCLRSALHGFVSLEIEGGFAMQLDLDESFELLVRQQDACLKAFSGSQKSMS